MPESKEIETPKKTTERKKNKSVVKNTENGVPTKRMETISFYKNEPLTKNLGKTLETQCIGVLYITKHGIVLFRYHTATNDRSRIIKPDQYKKFELGNRIENLSDVLKEACDSINYKKTKDILSILKDMTLENYTIGYEKYRSLVKLKYRVAEKKLWSIQTTTTTKSPQKRKRVDSNNDSDEENEKIVNPQPKKKKKKVVKKKTESTTKKTTESTTKKKITFDDVFHYDNKKSPLEFINYVVNKKIEYKLMKTLIKSDILWELLGSYVKKKNNNDK